MSDNSETGVHLDSDGNKVTTPTDVWLDRNGKRVPTPDPVPPRMFDSQGVRIDLEGESDGKTSSHHRPV